MITVSATDGDATDNTVTYSIASGNDGSHFSINSSTGVITTNSTALDYESTTSYSLVIEAADSASSAQTGSTTVSIMVSSIKVPCAFVLDLTKSDFLSCLIFCKMGRLNNW